MREGLDGVLAEAKGCVILATFASSLSRVQTVLDLALPDQVFHCPRDILNGNVGMDTMLIKKVDAVGLESAERSIGNVFDVLGTTVESSLLPILKAETELGGNHNLLPFSTSLQPVPDNRLRLATLVARRQRDGGRGIPSRDGHVLDHHRRRRIGDVKDPAEASTAGAGDG